MVIALVMPFLGGGAAVRRPRAEPVRAGHAGRLEHPREGHARRAGVADAGRDDHAARADRRPAAAARAGGADHDRDADAALPRGDRRGGAGGCGSRGSPAGTTRGSCGRSARPRGGSARCSCAATSAASACTWRWCRAAGPARCPTAAARRRPRRGSPAWPPVLATAVRAGGGDVAAVTRNPSIVRDRGPPALLVERLAYAYPDGHQALFGIDLRVEPGERVAVLGPNGAGKTTLVLHLNGVLSGGSGPIEVAGLPVTKANAAGGPPPGRHRVPGPGRPAVHADRRRGRGVRPGELRPVRRRAGRARVHGGAGRGRHGRARRPLAAAPVRRPAAAGGAGDRAGLRPGDPGARRAVGEPGAGGAPRAGRGAAALWTARC